MAAARRPQGVGGGRGVPSPLRVGRVGRVGTAPPHKIWGLLFLKRCISARDLRIVYFRSNRILNRIGRIFNPSVFCICDERE